MTFALMELCIATFILFFNIGHIYCARPDQMPAPTVENILTTSATIVFDDSISGAASFIITLEPRHRTIEPMDLNTSTSPYETNEILIECTIYYVSIRAVNSAGDEGPAGNTTQFRTAPRLSTTPLATPLSSFVDVFFAKRFPYVTQWLSEYRQAANMVVVNTTFDSRFTGRLENLDPNTTYEVRIRPSEINGVQLAYSEASYSNWTSFRTEPLSIFGRVVLTQRNYTADYNTQYSTRWNETKELIENAYSGIVHYGVEIIRNEDDGSGKVATHYRLKVPTSDQNFTLSGENFTNSLINNGSRPVGTTYCLHNAASRRYTLLYSSASACSKIVERFMIVSPDDEETFEIHLNVASSSATTPEEDDSLVVNSDGSLVRDDGVTIRNVSRGTILTLTPKFLVKDCLSGGDSTTALYSEVFDATNFADSSVVNVIVTSTEKSESEISRLSNSVTANATATSLTMFIPAVEFAIKYEILNESETVLAVLEEADIDCYGYLKLEVGSLEPDTPYNFTARVTTTYPNGATETTFPINSMTTTVSTATTDQTTSTGTLTSPSTVTTTATDQTTSRSSTEVTAPTVNLETSTDGSTDTTATSSTTALPTTATTEQTTSSETSTNLITCDYKYNRTSNIFRNTSNSSIDAILDYHCNNPSRCRYSWCCRLRYFSQCGTVQSPCRLKSHQFFKCNEYILCKCTSRWTESRRRNHHRPSVQSKFFSPNEDRRQSSRNTPYRSRTVPHYQTNIQRSSGDRLATNLYRKFHNRNGHFSNDPGPHYWLTRTPTSHFYRRRGHFRHLPVLDTRHSYALYRRP